MTDMRRLTHCWFCLKAHRVIKSITQNHIILMIYLNEPLTYFFIVKNILLRNVFEKLKLTTIKQIPYKMAKIGRSRMTISANIILTVSLITRVSYKFYLLLYFVHYTFF